VEGGVKITDLLAAGAHIAALSVKAVTPDKTSSLRRALERVRLREAENRRVGEGLREHRLRLIREIQKTEGVKECEA
jgi:hypothetical protein